MPITPQMPDDVGAGGYDDTEANRKAEEAAAAASANAQQELERAIDARIARLTIAGPGVTGSVRTGWAINSSTGGDGGDGGDGTLTTFRAVKVVSGTPSAATFQILATEV